MTRRSKKKNNDTRTALECGRADSSSCETRALVVTSALVVAATLAVYIRSLGHEFSNIDDIEYILRNRRVLDGLTSDSVLWAFSAFHSANWHPLTWLSHMLDVQLYGTWAGRHHLTSILLHSANSVLLLVVLRLMTGSLWKSAFAAALFALHPQHVESVAWVAERKDVLSTFFMMWALLGYWRYTQAPSVRRYLLVVLAFALGLMSKPMLVTLPALLLLLDFWPLRRFAALGPSRLIAEKLPLAALSLASAIVTLRAQAAVNAISTFEKLPLGDRVTNALMSCVIYIAKTFWPVRLGNYYPYPSEGWSSAEIAGAALVFVAITSAALVTASRRPYLVWGWLWYLISLAPVIGIIQVGQQARADRYTYIPLIGIFVIFAYLGPELMSRLRLARFTAPVAVLVLAALGAASYVQVGYWRDGLTINQRAISVTQNNWYSHGSIGDILVAQAERLSEQGNTEAARRAALKAQRHLTQCISIAPESADAHDRLARTLGVLERVDEAIEHLHEAIRINPRNPRQYSHLGMALQSKGLYDEAIEQFEKAVALDPHYIEGHGNLTTAYYHTGRYALAWKHIRLCEQAGGRAPQEFINKLSLKMPDPDR